MIFARGGFFALARFFVPIIGDKSHIIYVNGENRDDTPLGWLMHDFACSDPSDMRYEILADKVSRFKGSEKGVKEMGSVMQECYDEGMFNTLFGLVKDGIVQMKAAAERTNLSEEEFKAKMEEYLASSH